MRDDFREQKGNQEEKPGDHPEEKNASPAWVLWIIGLLLVAGLVYSMVAGTGGTTIGISYTEFRQQVRDGNVAAVQITGSRIQGETNAPLETAGEDGETISSNTFSTYLPTFSDDSLFPLLEENGVVVESRPQRDFWGGLFAFLPWLLLLGVGLMLLRRNNTSGGEAATITKSRARLYDNTRKPTTFDDVAGASGAKQELQEIIEYLRQPDRFQALGAEMPKGVLLVGPPGTGKTLLARAVAGEANAAFFSLSGSDFMEVYVGVGASRVRGLFEQAKKSSPAIIFIDELDSIGRRRSAGPGGGQEEREQTLNQMLNEMDGFEPTHHVIVMAATNRPDILDPALLRPGRFDRQVVVDIPTTRDRLEILRLHAHKKPLANEVDLERVARGTPGFSGADLANLLNEAALLAARRSKTTIGAAEIEAARDKVIMGLERNLTISPDELRLVAYHEAGHAVVAACLPHADPVQKVTIVPRGRAMGVTEQLPEERHVYPREYLLDRMAVLMGGRAAEELFLNTKTSGAEEDLRQAARLARMMVLNWGMSDRLGAVAYDVDGAQGYLGEEYGSSGAYSPQTAREIDEEVRLILQEAHRRAVDVLQAQRRGADRLVAALLEKEQVSGAELKEFLEG